MTLLKVLIVAFTIGSANLGNDDGALGGKRPSQFDSIVENIVVLLLWLSEIHKGKSTNTSVVKICLKFSDCQFHIYTFDVPTS